MSLIANDKKDGVLKTLDELTNAELLTGKTKEGEFILNISGLRQVVSKAVMDDPTMQERIKQFATKLTDLLVLTPYIQQVLDGSDNEADKEIQPLSVIEAFYIDGEDSEYYPIYEKAEALLAKFGLTEEIKAEATAFLDELTNEIQRKDNLPVISTKQPSDLTTATDKVNNYIWGPHAVVSANGQIAIDFNMTSQRSKQALVLYSLTFDNLEDIEGLTVSKKLTAFDRRCHDAAWSLFLAGNKYFTASDIYRAMGNTGKPAQKNIANIRGSMYKMRGGEMTIDNTPELEINKKYPQYKYNGPIMPFEEIQTIKNGKVVETTYHIFREPPLGAFARGRQNITTIPMKVLQSPLNQTENTLAIENYLYHQIRRMERNPKHSRRILYQSLFVDCGITEKMQQSRAKKTIAQELDHYKTTSFIKDYTEEKDGVTITLAKTRAKSKK